MTEAISFEKKQFKNLNLLHEDPSWKKRCSDIIDKSLISLSLELEGAIKGILEKLY